MMIYIWFYNARKIFWKMRELLGKISSKNGNHICIKTKLSQRHAPVIIVRKPSFKKVRRNLKNILLFRLGNFQLIYKNVNVFNEINSGHVRVFFIPSYKIRTMLQIRTVSLEYEVLWLELTQEYPFSCKIPKKYFPTASETNVNNG